jgi:hypothetical protein
MTTCWCWSSLVPVWIRAVSKNVTPLATAPIRVIACCPSVADLPRWSARSQHELHALGDQALGESLADAARRAGDDCGLPLQLAIGPVREYAYTNRQTRMCKL